MERNELLALVAGMIHRDGSTTVETSVQVADQILLRAGVQAPPAKKPKPRK